MFSSFGSYEENKSNFKNKISKTIKQFAFARNESFLQLVIYSHCQLFNQKYEYIFTENGKTRSKLPSSIKSVLGLFTPYGQGIYLAISLSSFSTYTSKPHTQGYFQTFSPLSISLLAFMHAHTHTHTSSKRGKNIHTHLHFRYTQGKRKGCEEKREPQGTICMYRLFVYAVWFLTLSLSSLPHGFFLFLSFFVLIAQKTNDALGSAEKT